MIISRVFVAIWMTHINSALDHGLNREKRRVLFTYSAGQLCRPHWASPLPSRRTGLLGRARCPLAQPVATLVGPLVTRRLGLWPHARSPHTGLAGCLSAWAARVVITIAGPFWWPLAF